MSRRVKDCRNQLNTTGMFCKVSCAEIEWHIPLCHFLSADFKYSPKQIHIGSDIPFRRVDEKTVDNLINACRILRAAYIR
jgi:hypothetical protein